MTLLLPSREFKPSDIEDAFCAHSSLSLSVNCFWEWNSRIRLTWRKLFKCWWRLRIRPINSSVLRSEVFELFTGVYLFARHYEVLMSHLPVATSWVDTSKSVFSWRVTKIFEFQNLAATFKSQWSSCHQFRFTLKYTSPLLFFIVHTAKAK